MPNTESDGPTLTDSGIDESNLSQALIDFEIANARVVDLTQRLTELSQNLVFTREQLENYRVRCFRAEDALNATSTELTTIKTSKAYRVLRILGEAKSKWV